MTEKKKEKIRLTSYDPIEDPEEIIQADKDLNRKNAFANAYKTIMGIIPEYFLKQRKKHKNSTSGGSGFSQSIVVTPEKVTLETKEIAEKQEEKEIGD